MSSGGYPLVDTQRQAVDPRDSVWLSASAGTGKTEVLAARVLRLLLEEHTQPADILCLTFTKAGAAEMAVRVNERLASWVRMDDEALGIELRHIGATIGPGTRDRARSLFARVLDCSGGGLRIDTIHAFAQWLLAAFPGEAEILPGTRAMEDRARALLIEEVMAELVATADAETLATIKAMSLVKGPAGVRRWLIRCAQAAELWAGPEGWQAPFRERLCTLFGLPSDTSIADCAALCANDRFPVATLRQLVAINRRWATKTGHETADWIEQWLALDPSKRLTALDGFYATLLNKDGSPRQLKALEKIDAAYGGMVEEVSAGIDAARDLHRMVLLVDMLGPQLAVGCRFATMWDAAKAREGLVDFDDLIRKAAALLQDRAMGDWIRYKLDRQFDHILIDEAQDTNSAQWRIIDALTEEFFAGLGQAEERVRTIFTVGDTKQAIFGFQGTSPRNFLAARDRVAGRMRDLIAGDSDARALQDLDLDRSFRTAAAVLDFVDRAIATIGHAQFGLEEPPPPHVGQDRPGLVGLWNLVIDGSGGGGEGDDGDEGGDAEGGAWLARHDRLLADRIARQVKRWMDEGFPLVKKTPPRRAGPGDVMVLVRKRRELAALIVARLHAHGVPVAGVDRLRLGAPLAVQDLLAALRFAVQPRDDLTLASLLVSPLCGWSQQDLLDRGYRPPGEPLWHHLRASTDPFVVATVDGLRQIMRRADYDSPQALLHFILTGPMDGRRRLVARLGREANDPIDELLNAANAYASAHVTSLQGFLRWFDAGANDAGSELKREATAAHDQVRVMTVHGAKGLQAPIVILADTALAPDTPDELMLAETLLGEATGRLVPIPSMPKDQRAGPLVHAHATATAELMQEHWRLLYVAMTRAEEALFIAGSLGPREAKKGVAPNESWYARLLPLFENEPVASDIWGAKRHWGALAPLPAATSTPIEPLTPPPAWLDRPAQAEPRPPKPLAPSGLGESEDAARPLPAHVTAAAARRGVLIHALLERLPAVPRAGREARATAWLSRQAPEFDDAERADVLASALQVVDTPEFTDLFGPDALAEVPLAAQVGGQVIAGTADRLLVRPHEIVVCDFKTARRPPMGLDDMPAATLRQMAAYVAALEVIYPDRPVRAVVIYTQTPLLVALPAALMTDFKAGFERPQESFVAAPVD